MYFGIILVAINHIYFETVEDIHKIRMTVLNNLQENDFWKCFNIWKHLMEFLQEGTTFNETTAVQDKT
jgi:hypothetical protein